MQDIVESDTTTTDIHKLIFPHLGVVCWRAAADFSCQLHWQLWMETGEAPQVRYLLWCMVIKGETWSFTLAYPCHAFPFHPPSSLLWHLILPSDFLLLWLLSICVNNNLISTLTEETFVLLGSILPSTIPPCHSAVLWTCPTWWECIYTEKHVRRRRHIWTWCLNKPKH